MATAIGAPRGCRRRTRLAVAALVLTQAGSAAAADGVGLPVDDRSGYLADLLRPREATGLVGDGAAAITFTAGDIEHRGEHRIVRGKLENVGAQLQGSLGRERFRFIASETHRDGPDKRLGEDSRMALDFSYDLLPSGDRSLALIGSHYQRDRGPGRALGETEMAAGRGERRSGLGLRLDLFDRLRAESTFAWGERTDAPRDDQPDLRTALGPGSERAAGLAQQHRVDLDLGSADAGRLELSGDYSWAAPDFRGGKKGLDEDRQTVTFGAAFEQGPWALALETEAYGTNVLGDRDRETKVHTARSAELERQLAPGKLWLGPARIGIGIEDKQSRTDDAGIATDLPLAGVLMPLGAAGSVKRTLTFALGWEQDGGQTTLELRGLDRHKRTDEGSERGFGEAVSLGQSLEFGAFELAGEVELEANRSGKVRRGFASSGELAWRPAAGPELKAEFAIKHQIRRDDAATRRTQFELSGALGLDHLVRVDEGDRAFLEIVGEVVFEGEVAADGSRERSAEARALITGGWRF